MSASSLVSQGFGGYQGWGDAEADADFKATGGTGKRTAASSGGQSYSQPSSIDPIAQAQQINDFYKQQNQPAIQSLQASIPEIQNVYQTQSNYLKSQQEPLKQRYAAVMDKITKSTQLETSQEFGRRGISTQSGLYDQSLNNRLNPQLEQLGISQGQDISSLLNQIAQLGGQETASIRDVQNAIAQLQAGNAPSAVGAAQSILSQAEQARQFNVGAELEKYKATQPQTSLVTIGGRQKIVNAQTGEVIADLGPSAAGGGSTTASYFQNDALPSNDQNSAVPAGYYRAYNGQILPKGSIPIATGNSSRPSLDSFNL